jgi:hypothetical protein
MGYPQLGDYVIPAQAGIQRSPDWIPACAGMTVKQL